MYYYTQSHNNYTLELFMEKYTNINYVVLTFKQYICNQEILFLHIKHLKRRY